MINSAHRPEVAQTASSRPAPTLTTPQPAFFLRTKLMPPRPAPALLSRPRLVERLAANLGRTVTLVTASAGAGKTTLVADFVRAHAPRFVWYQLDHTDADPAVFLSYIAHGIRQLFPDFGQATLAYLQQSPAEVGQRPERAVDVLLNEALDHIDQPLVIVLDDYHHLGAAEAVHAAVDRLLAYQPDVLHTIIISRDAPPLQVARLRSQGELTTIDRNDLLFTDEETQILFNQVFGLAVTKEQLVEFRERTQGWIMALQLIRQVAQRQSNSSGGSGAGVGAALPDLSEILRQSERDVFDYFAEEVYEFEPEQARELLLHISLLARVELEICVRLYPDSGCTLILPSLVNRNVFVTVASDGSGEEYRLHPLFRDFLKRRFLSEVGRSGVVTEHARLAGFFLSRGNWEQAMRHFLEAEEFDRAARMIADRGQEWIASGALGSLAASADALPAEAMERYPRALTHRAEVARLRGEYDKAQAMLRRAAVLLQDLEDCEGEAETLHSLATISRRYGDYTAAFAYLERAIELTDEHSDVRTKCGNTRGLCLVALGKWTEAESEFRAALQSAEEQHDEYYARWIVHNLGLPAMVRGDFGEALRWLRRPLLDDHNTAPMPRETAAHLNVARCYLFRGDFVSCERHLDSALEYCQLFNLLTVRAETFETYGNLYRELSDTARAIEFYERAERDYDKAGIEPARRELLEEQSLLKMQMGDLASARKLIEQLVNARRELGDEMRVQTAALTRGRVMIAQGEEASARADLEPALKYFRQNSLYYYEAQACMALAQCDLAAGSDVQMLERLRRAVDLAARYDYEHWLRRELAWRPQLFKTPEAAELLPPDAREFLASQVALQEPAPVQTVQEAALIQLADLTINLLGHIEIFRDPKRLFAVDAWTTRRAHDILCFIASRRHRRASKDTIIDTFWGEADFDVVAKNFHPTVSHIRKALNSNQPLKQNFLLYRDSDYLLNPDFAYSIDIEEFDRLVAEGDSARRARDQDRCVVSYEAAIKLYRGEFMRGCYDEWVEEQRSYYNERYLHILETLAVVALGQEEWPRTLQLAHQILRDDPYREDIHCLVMRTHAAQGNRAAVKEQYETLRALLRKELGIEPASETQKVYRGLIG
ncbi:MAG TPA: BTAD domain-containing putative transcriptional regulator [Blastocatellia bacterium]|nr:BTAD domain-containing putative transcriptional regulator [Blastocatellia bacterium]